MKEEKKADPVKEAVKEKVPVLYPRKRIEVGLVSTFFGFLLVVLGSKPEFFGMDRSPVIGFMQTATFLVGLGVIGLSGYFCLMSFWPKGYTTITADFGADRGFFWNGRCFWLRFSSADRVGFLWTAPGNWC